MTRFRYVMLDDEDNVIEILYESKEYPDKWKAEQERHEVLLDLNRKYDFYHYDECPNIEIHFFENGRWRYDSSAVEDFYNL